MGALCPEWEHRVQNGSTVSRMGAPCPEWEHRVQNGSTVSRMGAPCPEWEHRVQNGSTVSRMGAPCPEWEDYVQNGRLTQESPKMVFVFVFWHSVSVMVINDVTTSLGPCLCNNTVTANSPKNYSKGLASKIN